MYNLKVIDLLSVFYKPSSFFINGKRYNNTYLVFFCAYSMAIIQAIEKLERNAYAGRAGYKHLLDGWPHFWLGALGGGLFSLLWYWFLGGWWYKTRLIWSKGRDVSTIDARHTMIFANIVISFPVLLSYIVDTLTLNTPRESFGNIYFELIYFYTFSVYSIIISYKAARLKFNIDKTRGVIWFIVLPLVVLGIFLAISLANI